MSEQLKLWMGRFGDDYHTRNIILPEDVAKREAFWSVVLNTCGDDIPKSILEVGAGNGINIQAIGNLYKRHGHSVVLEAVEPNEKARLSLLDQNICQVVYPNKDIAEGVKYDMVFTSGVLIHINPEELLSFTKKIYSLSNKYIVCAEYFRPEPETKKYRDKEDALFIRDFGSFYLDNFPLQCIAYGFQWKRMTGMDDLTWQLFKKAH